MGKEIEGTDIERVHCNKCSNVTKHYVLAAQKKEMDSSEYPYPYSVDWSDTYEILECCGCEEITFRRTIFCSEWEELEFTFFPPRVSRRAPSWIQSLEDYETKGLLAEIYTALHADNRRLAVMGARSVLDRFLVAKVGDCGSFKKKLEKLEDGGHVSDREREVLQAALEAGHAAAHRGHQASPEEVNMVMDIVESLLRKDLLEAAANDLREVTPAHEVK